jgi:hypothetical protein
VYNHRSPPRAARATQLRPSRRGFLSFSLSPSLLHHVKLRHILCRCVFAVARITDLEYVRSNRKLRRISPGQPQLRMWHYSNTAHVLCTLWYLPNTASSLMVYVIAERRPTRMRPVSGIDDCRDRRWIPLRYRVLPTTVSRIREQPPTVLDRRHPSIN